MNKTNSFISTNISHQEKAILFLEKMASFSNQNKKLNFRYSDGKYFFEYKEHTLFYQNTVFNQMFFGVRNQETDILIEIPQKFKTLFYEVVYPEKVIDEIINSDSSLCNSFLDKLFRKVSKFFNN